MSHIKTCIWFTCVDVLWPSPVFFLQTEWTFHPLWSDCVFSQSAGLGCWMHLCLCLCS